MRAASLSLVALFGSAAFSHVERAGAKEGVHRRQLEAEARHRATRNCAPAIRAFHHKRRQARNVAEEFLGLDELPDKAIDEPHDKSGGIHNNTCVLTPETTEGPYYVRNELVRRDIRQGQPGVPLTLNIGVLDISTCKPLSRAFVEIWHSNSTGFYSGYTGYTLPFEGNDTTPPPIPTDDTFLTPPMTDELNFLRGGWPTDKEGVVEFQSIYPGFYNSRTVHIHAAVQTNWTKARNGTIESTAGNLLHIGQIYFDDAVTDKVVVTKAYLNTTQRRLHNSEDILFPDQNSGGYNALAETYQLGAKIEEGILTYITIGVDPAARYSFSSPNYWTPD
ncbi:Intradiol ring-cleavage dioxygenase [Cantharellus anzutake]|uniref:Intradiol ring-cleavage dioxygenase n=1 Tax=Cantharellus anzutake TaxID=1750568 RepID=UPI00190578C4|nr:Intradiol ring-cleavage dioxygenase [Cantharellus anzutake]KAF8326186.1 Intradiol ring-cleavage dioxygenase [Cantharellus anzutake]